MEQQSRRRCPDLGPAIATTGIFDHDPVHTGLTCTGPCYGENIAGFFNGVSEPEGDSLYGPPKSLYGGHRSCNLAPSSAVITLRWSGRPRARSVVGPRPRCWWSSFQHIGVSLRPSGQRSEQLPYGAAAPPADQGAAAIHLLTKVQHLHLMTRGGGGGGEN